MTVIVDSDEAAAALALNTVKVIHDHFHGGQLHVTITDEGMIADFVRDGEIASSVFVMYDLLDLSAEADEQDT